MRKFWRAAEAAILNVEELRDGLDLGVYNAEVKLRPSAGESLGPRHSFRKGIRGTRKLVSAVAVGIRHGKKHPAEAGPAHLVFGREICSTEKGLAVGKQKASERPTALPGDGADGGLIARVNIGALVAIHFDGHEVIVDDLGDFDVFVAFSVNDMAPVASHGANVEEDGLIL